MLSKQEKSELRGKLFRHLDGIVTCPAAHELHAKGITEYLLEAKKTDLTELSKIFKANEGYLNVALRTFASQGWLEYKVDNDTNMVTISTNELSETAFSHFHMYREATELLKYSEKYSSRKFEIEPFRKLESLFQNYKKILELLLQKMSKHQKFNIKF